MKEYIERAVVKDEILSWAVCINHPELLSKEDTIYLIDSLPAADVAEVRHGRWVRDKWPSGTHKLICSECREWSGKKSRYCPSCGAHMDKEGSND